jgi:hypothetical protein
MPRRSLLAGLEVVELADFTSMCGFGSTCHRYTEKTQIGIGADTETRREIPAALLVELERRAMYQ